MGWESAGEAWGSRAVDWAYLFEPYARPANQTVFDQCGVTVGTSVLDIGCGSGFALRLAADRGAAVAGLDASAALLEVARARTTDADLRVGDMNALPWGDGAFDVVTSFNSIWVGCEQAAAEAARVLKPGGTFGMTFWGPPKRLGLLPYFITVAQNSPPSHTQATLDQGQTGRPGVAEALLESAELRVRPGARLGDQRVPRPGHLHPRCPSGRPVIPRRRADRRGAVPPGAAQRVRRWRRAGTRAEDHQRVRVAHRHQVVVWFTRSAGAAKTAARTSSTPPAPRKSRRGCPSLLRVAPQPVHRRLPGRRGC